MLPCQRLFRRTLLPTHLPQLLMLAAFLLPPLYLAASFPPPLADACREPLDLHLLAGGHHHTLAGARAELSDDAGSAAGADGGGADADLASPSKRAKAGPAAAPAGGLHLALAMDYEKAAESINLELLGAGGAQRK